MDTEGFAKVLAEHKELTINGFETSLMRLQEQKRTGKKPEPKRPPTPEGTQLCVEWLLKHDALDRRQTVNPDRSSYNWKHVVEKDIGQYVSNGEFICAFRKPNLSYLSELNDNKFKC